MIVSLIAIHMLKFSNSELNFKLYDPLICMIDIKIKYKVSLIRHLNGAIYFTTTFDVWRSKLI